MRKVESIADLQKLLAEMTLDEKVGQLNQVGLSIVGGFEVSFEELLDMKFDGTITEAEFKAYMADSQFDLREEELKKGAISSYNGVSGANKVNPLQKIAIEESRLGIPLLFGYDVVHGYRTVFPIPLGESCSWDVALFEETAKISADEASACGINWTFAPMIDVSRDARWGRVSEGAGEDPYLTSEFAKAKVRGYQGEHLSNPTSVLACAKHFVAYGGAESGRDYNTVDISMQTLHDIYLPPFKAAVSENVTSIMPAFNDVSGVPCSVNSYLLTDVLQDQFDFTGVLISDANAIPECINHGVAETKKEAVYKAFQAGMHMDMLSETYVKFLKELVEEGKIAIEDINKRVLEVLILKWKKGLFSNPYMTNEKRENETVLKEEYRKKAREAAQKSIVLLKNEQLLPLKKELKIGLVGTLAVEKEQMLGAWSIGGIGADCVSIYEGLKNANATFIYEAGYQEDNTVEFKKLEELAKKVDVIVAVVGEKKEESGEAASKVNIRLPQEDLLKALSQFHKPVVALLINGRPVAIPWVKEHIPAIVECWQLGIEAGNAIADILFGVYNPSGKLTMTFPHEAGQCPVYYNAPTTGRPGKKSKFTSKYIDIPLKPVYPFGYGLSYTTFEYNEFRVAVEDNKIVIQVTISNTGDFDGEEIVQVYIQDVVASQIRPQKELKAFKKVFIKLKEKLTVSFQLEKEQLKFHNQQLEYVFEPGTFKVFVGRNCEDLLESTVTFSE